jgi:translation elongation factor P/translation initiation factor 5A
MAVLRDECGSCTGTYQTLSGDGNQFLFVNAEEFTDIEVEEDPKPTTSAVIHPEPAVSCVSSVTHSGQMFRLSCHAACLSVCLSTESFGLW